MIDKVTKAERSRIMSQIRGSGNKSTEIGLVKIFRSHGIKGWRRHHPLLGKPDFFFSKQKLCVFADGCFWHGCPKCYSAPKSNKKFWMNKIESNMRRDRKVRRKLRHLGYSVYSVWECDIAKRPNVVASKILRALKHNC